MVKGELLKCYTLAQELINSILGSRALFKGPCLRFRKRSSIELLDG